MTDPEILRRAIEDHASIGENGLTSFRVLRNEVVKLRAENERLARELGAVKPVFIAVQELMSMPVPFYEQSTERGIALYAICKQINEIDWGAVYGMEPVPALSGGMEDDTK